MQGDARGVTAVQEASAPPCDCCGAAAWRRVFTLSGVDLGRCDECGLHYIAQMPAGGERTAEVEEGRFRGDQEVLSAALHLEAERNAEPTIRRYVDLAEQFAPPGRWLDVGCGAGTLIHVAQERGLDVEGVELGRDRLELARERTGATIHDRPVEALDLDPESVAAVTMINVFSHLTSPRETFSVIHRALLPGGVLVLHTSEIGPRVQPRHHVGWELGEHLFFLGERTIERYGDELGFDVVKREAVWMPDAIFSREWFAAKGRSRWRNLAKTAILRTPGGIRALRGYMVRRGHADNPVHASTIVLRKAKGARPPGRFRRQPEADSVQH